MPLPIAIQRAQLESTPWSPSSCHPAVAVPLANSATNSTARNPCGGGGGSGLSGGHPASTSTTTTARRIVIVYTVVIAYGSGHGRQEQGHDHADVGFGDRGHAPRVPRGIRDVHV